MAANKLVAGPPASGGGSGTAPGNPAYGQTPYTDPTSPYYTGKSAASWTFNPTAGRFVQGTPESAPPAPIPPWHYTGDAPAAAAAPAASQASTAQDNPWAKYNNLLAPTDSKTYWDSVSGSFDPSTSAASQYYNGVSGKLQGGSGLTNRADPYASSFDPNQLSYGEQLFGSNPNMGAYYDFAQKQGQKGLDSALASRGLFDSGAALEQSRDFTGQLAADRAQHEAQYGLDVAHAADAGRFGRSSEARNWADELFNQDKGVAGENLDYMKTGGALAAQADQDLLSKLLGGSTMAASSSAAEGNRINNMANIMGGYTGAQAGRLDAETIRDIGNKLNLTEDQINGLIAQATQAYDAADANKAQRANDRGEVGKMVMSLVGG